MRRISANTPGNGVRRSRRTAVLFRKPDHVLQTLLIWILLCYQAGMATAADGNPAPTLDVKFVNLSDSKNGLVIEGFDSTQMDALRQLESHQASLQKCVRVHVVTDEDANWEELEESPSVMGKTSVLSDPPSLLFEPRFSLRDGIRYRARIQFDGCDFQCELFRPTESISPTATVERIYPSKGQLPENLLKFYIHFSHPMSMRNVYQHIHLIDEDGVELVHPFLEIQEELWDPKATRLTLLLDPGRIKRGLVPNLEDGSILHSGRSYELRVDTALQDARGQPLTRDFSQRFSTVDSDHLQPVLEDWQMEFPKVGTRTPLVIRFGESLDQALADRGIRLQVSGRSLDGQFSLSASESECYFLPADNWEEGDYELQVETYVEDLAGNSLRKPFEMEMAESQRQLPEGYAIRRFRLE